MTTQYTTILKLALPVSGELSGTWGDVVNNNITQMVEQAVAGKAVINSWTNNAHTLTSADGTSAESRCAILDLTDTGTALSGVGSVVCPAQTKLYIVENNTARVITVKTPSGNGVAVPVNKTMLVYCDGTNVVEGLTHANSLSLGTSTTTASSILDEDNMASNSATALSTQQSIKAYVDSQVATADTLTEVLANGNTTSGRDVIASTDDKVQFRDTAIYINSSTDGQLDIVADTEIQIAATTVDINGAVALNGAITGGTNITISGELDAATLDISGNADIAGNLTGVDNLTMSGVLDITNTTESTSTTTGALKVAGGVGVEKDLYVEEQLFVGNAPGSDGTSGRSIFSKYSGSNFVEVVNSSSSNGGRMILGPTSSGFNGLYSRNYNATAGREFRLIQLSATVITVATDGDTTFVGDVTTGSSKNFTGGNFITSSDKRLKSEIEPIKKGLEVIKQFTSYNYIKGGKKESGFIAQEVQKVLPHTVYENSDGMLSMSDRGVVAHMHKAILELEKRLISIEEKLK